MAKDDTPPASPMANIDDLIEEDADINEEGAIEVIDLDEEFGFDDEEEEDNDLLETVEEEGSMIVQDIKDNASFVFKQHTKSVFCIDVQPVSQEEKPLVASGGEDDMCYIWDLESGEVKQKLNSFKDSVTHVKFNQDGSYLAVADMSGMVMVLKVLPNLVQEPVWTFETGDISWLDWHPGQKNVLFAGTDDSSFWMWKIPSGQSKIFQGHGDRVESAVILPDGKKSAVGYSDGSLRIFDLRNGEVLHNLSVFNNKSPICAMDARTDNQLIAVGSAEGEVVIVNNQNGKIVANFSSKKRQANEDEEESASNSIESLIFSTPETNHLLSADVDGNLIVWDLSSHVAKISKVLGTGLVKLAWWQNYILVATFDGLIRIVDPRSGDTVADCSGHLENVLDIALSKDSKYLVSSSDDKTCRVYNMEVVVK